ncbi:MAG: YfiR/HmsC family protein [Gemmatimonadota bacterium]|nr:YfiR/HmsC family protein [Gemmatimonadota bacterium]
MIPAVMVADRFAMFCVARLADAFVATTVAVLGIVAGFVPAVTPRGAQAQGMMEVPAAVHVPLFLKVLSFDRQLRARAANEVLVVVAYQGGNGPTVRLKDEVLRLIAAERIGIAGLPLRALAVDLDRESLAETLRATGAAALYVPPLRGLDLSAVIAAARAARVTTFSAVPAGVASGLAVGVRLQGDRPRLLVNVAAARLEGADFSAELLKLAVLVP